jgi:hypothetical protein
VIPHKNASPLNGALNKERFRGNIFPRFEFPGLFCLVAQDESHTNPTGEYEVRWTIYASMPTGR